MNPIVEVEGKLYINLGVVKNREDMGSMAYDRDVRLYPYSPELPDDLHLSGNAGFIYELRGTQELIVERKDKVPYAQYGYSRIRGKETIMLERVYPKAVAQPTT